VQSEEVRSSEATSIASTEEFSANSKEAPAERAEDEEEGEGEEEGDDDRKLSVSNLDELARELEQVRHKILFF